MVESPDSRAPMIATNGYMKPAITVVDVRAQRVSDTLVLDHAWLGLAWHPDGKRLYVSGAGNHTVHELRRAEGKLTCGPGLVLGRPMEIPAPGSNRPDPVPQSFVGGLAVTPDGTRLFAVHVLGQLLGSCKRRSAGACRARAGLRRRPRNFARV